MKLSNFDKWLTTEYTERGVWKIEDETVIKRSSSNHDSFCSCHDWNEETKKWNETGNCKIHEEAK